MAKKGDKPSKTYHFPKSQICIDCSRTYPEGFKFCPVHGYALIGISARITCPGCSKKLDPRNNYCPYCGREQNRYRLIEMDKP